MATHSQSAHKSQPNSTCFTPTITMYIKHNHHTKHRQSAHDVQLYKRYALDITRHSHPTVCRANLVFLLEVCSFPNLARVRHVGGLVTLLEVSIQEDLQDSSTMAAVMEYSRASRQGSSTTSTLAARTLTDSYNNGFRTGSNTSQT